MVKNYCPDVDLRGEVNFVLAKKFRIQSTREFKRIYKFSKKINTDFFVVRFIANRFENPRFGIVISKKISLLATKRNKIKRQINNILYQSIESFKKSYDIVLITRKKIAQATYQEIEKDIEQLLGKIDT